MNHLKEQRAAKYKAAMELIAKQKGGVDLSQDEVTQLQSLVDEVKALDAQIKANNAANALFGQLASEPAGPALLKLAPSAEAIKAAMPPEGLKGIIENGQTATLPSTTLVSTEPIPKERPRTTLLDLIPFKQLPKGQSHWSYFRQITRTNAAAPVALGAVKPQSAYEVEKVESKLTVIAHTSSPLDTYWELDHPGLVKFIQDELAWGLTLAVESQLFAGNGTAPNLRGFSVTSGIQTQAFVTDALTTIRNAQLKLEVVGIVPGAIVMHPTDWLTIELLKTTQGAFVLGANGQPVQEPYRHVFGTQVVTSLAVTPGTAWVIGVDTMMGVTDAQGIILRRGTINDDFLRNQSRLLMEGRFGLEVYRAQGIVKTALTAA